MIVPAAEMAQVPDQATRPNGDLGQIVEDTAKNILEQVIDGLFRRN